MFGLEMIKPLLLVLILAGGLRFANLTFDSLWLDESYQTVIEAYGNGLPDLSNPKSEAFLFVPGKVSSCHNVLTNFRRVDPLCPPLYAILINRWLSLLGGSDYTLRAFSALCSILSVAAIYLFGSSLLGKRPALYAAILQTISPFDIYYAQEARMYSLVALCAILSGGSLLFLCLKKKDLKKSLFFALVYIITTWALINTHYTQLFVWCSFIILTALVFSISRKDLLTLALLIASNFCVVIFSLPWFSLFSQAAASRTASFYVTRQSTVFWPFWALFVRLPFNWLTFLAGKKVMVWAVPSYFTSACLIAYSPLAALRKCPLKLWQAMAKYLPNFPETKDEYFTLLLLLFWSIIPATMIWLLDVTEMRKVIEISRYLMGTAPAIFLIAGYSASRMEGKKYFPILLIAHIIFCLANNAYMHIIPQRENWRAVAQTIEHVCRANEVLLVSPYYNIVCLDRYLHNPLRQIGVSPTLGEAVLKNITHRLSLQTFWVLSAQEGDAIFNIIPSQYKIAQEYDFQHALHLRQYFSGSK